MPGCVDVYIPYGNEVVRVFEGPCAEREPRRPAFFSFFRLTNDAVVEMAPRQSPLAVRGLSNVLVRLFSRQRSIQVRFIRRRVRCLDDRPEQLG